MSAHLAGSGGNGASETAPLVGVISPCAGVNDVSEGSCENIGRPLAKHSMSIELGVRRCAVSQDEHEGEGAKESEDKFP